MSKPRKSYSELTEAKTKEVKLLEQQIMEQQQEKAESESTLEISKKDIKAITKSREADLKFQAAVEKHCTGSDAKFQERTKTRSSELQAVSKALEVFQGDESRDLLRKSVSFLQVASEDDLTNKAATFLMQQGRKLGAQSLVTLGLQGQLDPFTKVKEKIEEMSAVLTQQKKDEATHREMCVDDLNENALSTEDKGALKNRTEDKIQLMDAKISKCQKDVMSLRSEITEMKKQIQIAGQTRQKENIKFQTEATEQQQTQVILKKAVQFLKNFYTTGVSSKSSLVQIQSHNHAAQGQMSSRAEPDLGNPEGFQDYEKNTGGQGVISLIETIAGDAHKLEQEAIKDGGVLPGGPLL